MSDPSRRGFLKAGVGVAAAGVAVAGVAAASAETGAAGLEGAAPAPAGQREILAHVHDVRSGRISLMVEGQEITVTDPDLATRIATALHRSVLAPTL